MNMNFVWVKCNYFNTIWGHFTVLMYLNVHAHIPHTRSCNRAWFILDTQQNNISSQEEWQFINSRHWLIGAEDDERVMTSNSWDLPIHLHMIGRSMCRNMQWLCDISHASYNFNYLSNSWLVGTKLGFLKKYWDLWSPNRNFFIMVNKNSIFMHYPCKLHDVIIFFPTFSILLD